MIAERRLLFQIHGVLVLGFLLLIPGVLALYLGLRHVNQNVMVVAAAAGLLASIQVGWIAPLVLSEVALSDGYMAAAGEAQRAAYVAATDLVRAALTSGFFMRFFLFFLFILGSGLVMRRGNFGRRAANLSLWGAWPGSWASLAWARPPFRARLAQTCHPFQWFSLLSDSRRSFCCRLSGPSSSDTHCIDTEVQSY